MNVHRAIEIDRCSCNDCKCFHFAFFFVKTENNRFFRLREKQNKFICFSFTQFIFQKNINETTTTMVQNVSEQPKIDARAV